MSIILYTYGRHKCQEIASFHLIKTLNHVITLITSASARDEEEIGKTQTVMGVYVIQKEGAEPGDDVGVLIEGVEVLSGLGNIAMACALLFGLIYCLNLSYPPELKVLQKILLNLDGQRLLSKAQFLKNKLLE
uniref:Uncharacterized protein n=1 Tax=Hucho hucho TaxID=62062 RepID=A0A4W5QY34_9TELE